MSDLTPEIIVLLRAPDLSELDITRRVNQSELGSITDQTEEDLVSLIHGDLSLTVADPDGAVEAFLSAALPGEDWEVTIDRATGLTPPILFERVFGGVLDLPWSLEYDRNKRTVGVNAFSYTKILENASAETVK